MKRLLAFGASVAAAFLGTALIASPAQAHHSEIKGKAVCQADGKYEITWTVRNPPWPNPLMKIVSVKATPDTEVTEIKPDVWLEKDASVTGKQIVAGDVKEARLVVSATWHQEKTGPVKAQNTADGKVILPGKCAPPTALGESTCDKFTVLVSNSAEGESTEATVTYGTQVKKVTVGTGKTEKVELSPSSETDATVTFAGSSTKVTVKYTKPANCGGLPQTGSSTTTFIASGTGLAMLGGVVFFFARRRMVKLRRMAA